MSGECDWYYGGRCTCGDVGASQPAAWAAHFYRFQILLPFPPTPLPPAPLLPSRK
ncbi:MAG TPA: hypothetical protein VF680_01265 [Allosphingosinicella sp.]|jgi:hypothetical protein